MPSSSWASVAVRRTKSPVISPPRITTTASSGGSSARSTIGSHCDTSTRLLAVGLKHAVPGLDGMGQRWADLVAVALGGAGVDVAGEVGDLHEIVELIGDEGDERMAELVGGPLRPRSQPERTAAGRHDAGW